MKRLTISPAEFEALVQETDADEQLLIESDGKYDYLRTGGVEYRAVVGGGAA